jgi:DNA-binding response OmpR family regulator
MRLLVADDSATIRKLAEISFRGTSWALEYATTGAEAATKAKTGPDVILLDYVLPDMKAVDVCRRLGADAASARIPVVLVSSKSSAIRDELRAYSQVVDYLPKPFSSEELITKVTAAAAAATAPAPARPPSVSTTTPLAPELSFNQKEAAAKILFARLRPQLERLPAWALERGQQPAAAFFARKLLTPEVVEGLLRDFAAMARELAWGGAGTAGTPCTASEGEESARLQGLLEQLRRPSTWAGAGEPPSVVDNSMADLVYERASGFSARLRQLRLTANEQRALTVVDGRASLHTVAERTGLPQREVARILHRLDQVGLIQARHTLRASSVTTAHTLAVLDPDRQGVQQTLQNMLRRRPDPIEVRDLGGEPDPLAAIQRDRPCLVLLNPEGARFDITELARAVRRSEALANTALAALLERGAPAEMDRLAAAGFDAVWVKPVHFREVSQLIASAFLTAELVLQGEAPS